jgi:putative intracellular protease/amidase
MNILIVLSSTGLVPGTDRQTGTWLEELAGPYYTFREAGAHITLASVKGGAAPIDPAEGIRSTQLDLLDEHRRYAAMGCDGPGRA